MLVPMNEDASDSATSGRTSAEAVFVIDSSPNFRNDDEDSAATGNLVDDLEPRLEQMFDQVQRMSGSVVERFADFGSRLDDLEKNISDLIRQVRIFYNGRQFQIRISKKNVGGFVAK